MTRQTRIPSHRPVMTAVALAAACLPWTAQAQGASDPQTITITATKRAQDLQDVSASVTAINERTLEVTGVIDPTRLETLVPGLKVGYSGNEGRFAIRGARTNNVGVQAQQVVGVFNDGAYVATTGQTLASYLDVQRIEVLRGPQGTLYGRNTFAGAINIISNEADFDEFGGNVQGLLGDYRRTRAQAVVNVPVSKTFALRVAAMGERHDGYIKNSWIQGPSDDLRDENVQVGRISARWRPSKAFDTTLRLTAYDRDINSDAIWGYTQIGCYRNNGNPATSTGLSATGTYVRGHCWRPGPDSAGATGATGASVKRDNGAWDVARDTPSRATAKGMSLNLNSNVDFGPATLTVIAAQDKFKSMQYYDTDYSDGIHYAPDQSSLTNWFGGYDNDQTSRSIEVRLASNGNTRFKWLVGAYHFKQSAKWDFGYLDNGVYKRYSTITDNFDSTSQALFGNASFDLTDSLRVLGGLRSNKDRQKLIGGANGGGGDKPLWRAGVEWDLNKDLMFYATASTGYRVGGVNGAQLVAAGAPAVYGPETVTAVELGAKAQFMQKKLTLNTALYQNRYRNMHAQSFVTACVNPAVPATCIASEFTSNGGEVDAKGLEMELSWKPDRQLFVNASLALMDAKFGNYLVSRMDGIGNYQGRQDVTRTTQQIVAAGGTPALQLRGWRPALSPKVTANVHAGYQFATGADSHLTPSIQIAHTGQYWSFDYNLPGSEQKAFTTVDLRMVWRNEKKGITITGFIENATNQQVLTRSVIFGAGEANVPTASIQANYNNPRTWGLKLGVDF
ncbi:MAG: hypothetical protein RJA10_3825 [Pseudomonadota bacterium]